MAKDSEFRAYYYIEQALKDLGWDTRNPARGGQVYTQGEFRKHDPLLKETLGKKTPENIALLPWDGGNLYWIIEAKNSHSKIRTAINEARKYAEKVNESDKNMGGGSTIHYRLCRNSRQFFPGQNLLLGRGKMGRDCNQQL